MYQMCLYVARDPPVSVIDIELDKTKQKHTDIHIMHDIPNVVFFVTEYMSILYIPFTGTEVPTG